MASRRQNEPNGYGSSSNYANGHSSSISKHKNHNGYTNGHGLSNGHSSSTHNNSGQHVKGFNSVPNDIFATPEMCMYCFDVLEDELNNFPSPSSPNFSNEPQ